MFCGCTRAGGENGKGGVSGTDGVNGGLMNPRFSFVTFGVLDVPPQWSNRDIGVQM